MHENLSWTVNMEILAAHRSIQDSTLLRKTRYYLLITFRINRSALEFELSDVLYRSARNERTLDNIATSQYWEYCERHTIKLEVFKKSRCLYLPWNMNSVHTVVKECHFNQCSRNFVIFIRFTMQIMFKHWLWPKSELSNCDSMVKPLPEYESFI